MNNPGLRARGIPLILIVNESIDVETSLSVICPRWSYLADRKCSRRYLDLILNVSDTGNGSA